MANTRGNKGTGDRLCFLELQNHCRWGLQHEIKRRMLLGRKSMTNLDGILKSRDITLVKGLNGQSYSFSTSHVRIWELNHKEDSVSSVTQSCPTLCDPMDCSMPGFPVHHQLPEFTQTHVPWVSDAIQPSHPLSSPSPPVFNLSEHQGLFKWVSSSHQVAKVLESASTSVLPMNIQYWFPLGWTGLISLKNSPWRIYAFKLWC